MPLHSLSLLIAHEASPIPHPSSPFPCFPVIGCVWLLQFRFYTDHKELLPGRCVALTSTGGMYIVYCKCDMYLLMEV